jgi:acetyl esterase
MGRRSARTTAASAALRGLLALPAPLLRPFAGPPVRDAATGTELAPSTRVLLRMVNRRMPGSLADLARVRAASDAGGAVLAGRVGRDLWIEDVTLPGAEGPLRGRLYTPPGAAPGPLLVFFHGGGWILGSVDSHDPVCRLLAERARTRVLSAEYRLAPEHPFPAQYEDAVSLFRHVCADPGAFGALPGRIAVGGDSAGGNLAAAVTHAALRDGAEVPAGLLLIYPATDLTEGGSYPSRESFGSGFVIDTASWRGESGLLAAFTPDPADPRLSVLRDPLVEGMPPVYVATGGFDPLRDEGEAYAERLRAAGARVTVRRFEAQFHGFASFACVERLAGAAMDEIAAALVALFAEAGVTPEVRVS